MNTKAYEGRLYQFNNNSKCGLIACDIVQETIFFDSKNVTQYPLNASNLEDYIYFS